MSLKGKLKQKSSLAGISMILGSLAAYVGGSFQFTPEVVAGAVSGLSLVLANEPANESDGK